MQSKAPYFMKLPFCFGASFLLFHPFPLLFPFFLAQLLFDHWFLATSALLILPIVDMAEILKFKHSANWQMVRGHLVVWTVPNIGKIRQLRLLILFGPLSSLQPLIDALSAFLLPFDGGLDVLVHHITDTAQCQSVCGVKQQINAQSGLHNVCWKVLGSEVGVEHIQRLMLRMAIILREHLLTIRLLESVLMFLEIVICV